ALLAAAGVDVAGLVVDSARPTVTKTRIVAEGELRFPQQLARIDRDSRLPLGPATEAQVLEAARRACQAQAPAALLFSDYRWGLLSSPVGTSRRDRGGGQASRPLLTADTQGDLDKYQGFDLVKCNRAEAEAYLGQALADDPTVENALAELNE